MADEEIPAPDLVVAIGASAGAPEAFRAVLRSLPSPLGCALLLVGHVPDADENLNELLARETPLIVRRAEDGLCLTPDTAYVLDPGQRVSFQDGWMSVTPGPVDGPLNALFEAVASGWGERAVAIVLSGTGEDGAQGLHQVRRVAGFTMAQEPSTAEHPELPAVAIAGGAVDVVLRVDEMGAALRKLALQHQQEEVTGAHLRTAERLLPDLDVRQYKAATVRRRLSRRVALTGFDRVDDYLTHLEGSRREQEALASDLLIGVTAFFRDREAFRALAERIQDLAHRLESGAVLRAWVPGCSTGQEAYTLAILLLEAAEAADRGLSVRVFGTDLDQEALRVARAAVYPAEALAVIEPERRGRFFEPDHGQWRAAPRLREVVSFASHDLCADPPFSRMHVITCRNLLMYLRPAAQARVLEGLHFALEAGGLLMLGRSETARNHRDLFRTVSKPHRVYAKIGRALPGTVLRAMDTARARPADIARQAPVRESSPSELARKSILGACVPPRW